MPSSEGVWFRFGYMRDAYGCCVSLWPRERYANIYLVGELEGGCSCAILSGNLEGVATWEAPFIQRPFQGFLLTFRGLC